MPEEKQKPVFINELEYGEGEVVFSHLNEGDKFQLLARYLNDNCSFLKSILQVTADLYVLVEFICANMGIDVQKAKKELAEKYKKEMEEKLKKSKEQLEEVNKA